MTTRGRKRTPSKLKVIKGTDQPCRMNPDEAEPEVAIPSPPDHLNQEASVEWGRISKELYDLGLLTQIDRTALAGYCQSYGRWVKAENNIAQSGPVIKTTNGNVIQSPFVSMANKCLEIMHRYLTEFGMTPAARSRVRADKPKKNETKQGFGSL